MFGLRHVMQGKASTIATSCLERPIVQLLEIHLSVRILQGLRPSLLIREEVNKWSRLLLTFLQACHKHAVGSNELNW